MPKRTTPFSFLCTLLAVGCGAPQYSARIDQSPGEVDKAIEAHGESWGYEVGREPLRDGAVRYTVGTVPSRWWIAASPDGQWLIVAAFDRIHVVNLNTGGAQDVGPTERREAIWRTDGALIIQPLDGHTGVPAAPVAAQLELWTLQEGAFARNDALIPQQAFRAFADGTFLTVDREAGAVWHYEPPMAGDKPADPDTGWSEFGTVMDVRSSRMDVDHAGRVTHQWRDGECRATITRAAGEQPPTRRALRVGDGAQVDPHTGYSFAYQESCNVFLVALDPTLELAMSAELPTALRSRPSSAGESTKRRLEVSGPTLATVRGEAKEVVLAYRGAGVWLLPLDGTPPIQVTLRAEAAALLPTSGEVVTLEGSQIVIRSLQSGEVVRRVRHPFTPSKYTEVTVRSAGGDAWMTGGRLAVPGIGTWGEPQPGHRPDRFRHRTEVGVRVDSQRARPIVSTGFAVDLVAHRFGGDTPMPESVIDLGVGLYAALDLEFTTDQEDKGPLPGGRFGIPIGVKFATASREAGVDYVSGPPIRLEFMPGVGIFEDVVAPELTLSARYEPWGGLYGRVGNYDGETYYEVGLQGGTTTSAMMLAFVAAAAIGVAVAREDREGDAP